MASASSSTTVSSLSFSTSSNTNEDDEIETGRVTTSPVTTTKQLISLNSQQASPRPTAIPVVSLKHQMPSSSSQAALLQPLSSSVAINASSQANSALLLNKQISSESAESDLTELSWLTNSNIPLFGQKNNCLQPLIVPSSRAISRVPLKNQHLTVNHKSRQAHLHGTNGVVINGIYAHKLNNANTLPSSGSTSLHLKSSPVALLAHRSSSSSGRGINVSGARLNKTVSNSGSAMNINSSGQVLLEASNTNMSNTLNGVKFKNSCGLSKPALTLSCIIFMSIEESPDKCLQVRQIYEWIQENFPYYRLVSNPGWKSSVRHNLSFSKCFKKMDRASVNGETVSLATNLTTDELDLNASRKRRREQNQQQQQATSATQLQQINPGGGTYWKVNKECKLYLIHMLRKSSFWYHNSKYYSSLASHMDIYLQENLIDGSNASLRETRIKSQHYKYHNGCSRGEDGVKRVANNANIGHHDTDGEGDEDDDDDSASSTSLNASRGEKANDNLLYEFMQKQQQSLLMSNRFLENEKENDEKSDNNLDEIEKKALASFVKSTSSISPRESSTPGLSNSFNTANGVNKSFNPEDLNLSSSTSSLSSAFALLSASLSKKNRQHLQQSANSRQPATSETNPKLSSASKRRKTVEEDQQKKQTNNEERQTTNGDATCNQDDHDDISSDLEMEVASTLIGMKWSSLKK